MVSIDPPGGRSRYGSFIIIVAFGNFTEASADGFVRKAEKMRNGFENNYDDGITLDITLLNDSNGVDTIIRKIEKL